MISFSQLSAVSAPPVSGSGAAVPVVPTVALQFVTIDVHGRSYALPIEVVIEFRVWVEPTPLPHSPPYLLGIINIRGEIVPMFDVGARLGYGRSVPTPQHVITLVQTSGEQVVGLLVDDVSDILSVPAVTALAGGDPTDGSMAVDGVLEIGDAVLGIINVDALCVSELGEGGDDAR